MRRTDLVLRALPASALLLGACGSWGGASGSLLGLTAPRSVAGTPHRLEPGLTRQVSNPGVRAQLSFIELGEPLIVHLVIETTETVALQRSLLAPRASGECREGVRESRLVVDDQYRWARPVELRGGSHQVVLEFARGRALLDRASAIDLVLAGSAEPGPCLRVPLNGLEPELEWKQGDAMAAGGSVRGYIPFEGVSGLGAGWTYEMKLGAAARPFLVLGEVGIGLAACTHDCRDDDLGFVMLPFGAAMQWFFYDGSDFSLDLGVAQRFIYASVGPEGSSRSVFISAPTLSLRIAETVHNGLGLPGGALLGSSGLELSGSLWRHLGDDGPKQALVLGFSWSWAFSL